MVEAPIAGYPLHWEADVLLADGGVAHLRPSGPGDEDAIRAMHARSSAKTLYLRYFSPVSTVSEQKVAIFTDVDYDSRVGLVAVVGGQMIAAGTYHRSPVGDTDSAEIAFLVEDSQHGRGLGSILLEHLAAAAQERGIHRFTAEVLGQNTTMLGVLVDAGYTIHEQNNSGVVDLVFDIEPTEKSRAVMTAREHRAEARSIARLLSPRSIAVIGASREPTKLGHVVLENLLRGGFTGPVFPVNPAAGSVQGVRAYACVADIPDPVDLAVVTVPARHVAEVVEQCRAKGVHGLVVITAGFADAGPVGADEQRRLVALARGAGMRVLGPNCLGLINTDPAVRMNATLAPLVPPSGRVGFFCQSGALGIAILADAAARGLGLSTFVSAGNRADVSGNDLLQFWYGDDRTEVVLLYLESFGNPRKFARLARVLARTKPVIAVKSGRHATPTPATGSNAAPMSGAAVASLFAQSGVIRTETLAAAFDVAQLLSTQPVPVGDRVAVIGNSTALSMLAVDACRDADLRVTDGRPLDLEVGVNPEDLAEAVRAALARADVDALVVVYVPVVATTGLAHAAALRSAVSQTTIPVLTTFPMPADGNPARGSLPSFRTPERAVVALAHAVRYGSWLTRPAGTVPDLPGIDIDAARALMTRLRGPDDPPRALTDDEVTELLDSYGISLLPYRAIGSAAEAVTGAAEIGYPVMLKSFDHSLRHRMDRSGVRLGLNTADQLTAAYEELSGVAGPWLDVQAMAPRDRSDVSTVFAISADPSFGVLVSFGIGGVATELLDDRAYRAVPLTTATAAELISAPRAAALLDGYRGTRLVAHEPLIDLALRLSTLADQLPEVSELELRPVLVGPAGLAVTSATCRIGPAIARPDTTRRLH
ncbi:bifunctional acetate--CoA ligase family protein/GNAT family N-acetyltransferase [Nakamurella sp. GG22]